MCLMPGHGPLGFAEALNPAANPVEQFKNRRVLPLVAAARSPARHHHGRAAAHAVDHCEVVRPDRVRFRHHVLWVGRPEREQVEHGEAAETKPFAEPTDTPKRRVKLVLVCGARVQSNPRDHSPAALRQKVSV
jgi:hypothetical protein